MDRKLTQERRSEIAGQLLDAGKVSAAALARQYGVSTETIRKDLMWLERRGLAQRGYGGAIAPVGMPERSFVEKATDNRWGKHQIALAVSERIPPGATVLLDSGSTVLEAARLLAGRSDLTFFTNSLQAAQLLAGRGRAVFLAGGSVRSSSLAVTGAAAAESLGRVNADIALLGASGFDNGRGPCVESVEEAEMKRAMICAARSAILLADASKYSLRARVQFGAWRDFDLLITDGGLSDAALSSLREQLKVWVAEVREEEEE